MVPVEALIHFPYKPKNGWESLPTRFEKFPFLANFHFMYHPKRYVCWFFF